MLLTRFLVVVCFSVGAIVTGTGVVSGQNYPNKPIRLITNDPGGGNDFAARIIAQGLTGSLGQHVIVDNRGGAGGAIAGETVAKAPPDGYTLLLFGSAIWILPLLRDHVPYDPVRDFSAITMATKAPAVLVVHPAVAANSVKELIALAKAKPAGLNYASGAVGGSTLLAAELFKAMAGVNIVCVNYKGPGAALNAVISGEVQLMFPTAAAMAPHVKTGRLRALAVTGSERSALVPDLPTVAASGLPDYESVSAIGVFAPAKTPAGLINRLNKEIVAVLGSADVKEKLLRSGVEAVGSSPQQLAAAVKSDIVRLGKVLKDAGIHE